MTDAPLVGIIMGSDSDLPVMRDASDALTEFGIAHEVRVISAHRTPQAMLVYAERAAERGLQVIIAGAGGAAHLPGMVAAATTMVATAMRLPIKVPKVSLGMKSRIQGLNPHPEMALRAK